MHEESGKRRREPNDLPLVLKLFTEHPNPEIASRRKKVLEKLAKTGLLTSSQVILDPQTWIGHAQRGELKLGTQPLPDVVAKQVFLSPEGIDTETSLIYRFSHELAHLYVPEINRDDAAMAQLFQIAFQLRETGRPGLSGLGSIDFYQQQGPRIQATEDVVELSQMYVFDPQYLHTFLERLTLSDQTELRYRLRVTALQTPVANHLYKTISTGIDEWLR